MDSSFLFLRIIQIVGPLVLLDVFAVFFNFTLKWFQDIQDKEKENYWLMHEGCD